jgi:cyclophilin family peptidyl-prolyl cis-trans isomerase
MIQTGDPLGTGSETGYKFKDEINDSVLMKLSFGYGK